jgi:DNA mismatch repair ATPase MutS
MAGKSTFLRMVAVNVVLAQTIHFCCAGAYAATPFRIASSITHMDDITGSTSYFLAEGRRLLQLLQNAEKEHTPYICLIDEMLRGTNAAERHAASLAVLRHLADAGAVVIVASHDTDLGYMLEDRYRLCHFSESFEQDNLVFDYRLKPGICASGNAIRTLGWLGFPDAVVEEARERLAQAQRDAVLHGTGSDERSSYPGSEADAGKSTST